MGPHNLGERNLGVHSSKRLGVCYLVEILPGQIVDSTLDQRNPPSEIRSKELVSATIFLSFFSLLGSILIFLVYLLLSFPFL